MAVKERRKREKEQRRSDILDAARTLLLEDGLKATSINRVAKLSELSIGAIYFYFKNKEEVYAALQVEGLDLLYRYIREAHAESTTPENAVRKIALAYLRYSEEHKNYFDIINYFLSSPETIFPSEMKRQIDEHGKSSIMILAEAIREGMQQGVFKEVNPKQEALILWSACHGAITTKKLKNTIMEDVEYPSLFKAVVERFLCGLRR
jgi:AcrR family transcriptional regulator